MIFSHPGYVECGWAVTDGITTTLVYPVKAHNFVSLRTCAEQVYNFHGVEIQDFHGVDIQDVHGVNIQDFHNMEIQHFHGMECQASRSKVVVALVFEKRLIRVLAYKSVL